MTTDHLDVVAVTCSMTEEVVDGEEIVVEVEVVRTVTSLQLRHEVKKRIAPHQRRENRHQT